jgi:hypothetical protein
MRDKIATNTFLHLTRYFQGPSLPPSNAVHPYPLPGMELLPPDYHPARKGTTTFFFRFHIPHTSPSSIDFGKGLAKLRYEVRAIVGIAWEGKRQLLVTKKDVDIVEAASQVGERYSARNVVVAEKGKLWVQGRVMNPYVVSGQSVCVELHVKNHSTKKVSHTAYHRCARVDNCARRQQDSV